MSFSICGRIQTNCVDNETIKKAILEFFSLSEDALIMTEEKSIIFEGLDKENILAVFFVKEVQLHYNIYFSDITNSEFSYAHLVIFDIQKEEATIETNKRVIDFFIYFSHRIKSDILVTSDAHNEICLVKEKEVVWSQDLSYNYQAICRKY